VIKYLNVVKEKVGQSPVGVLLRTSKLMKTTVHAPPAQHIHSLGSGFIDGIPCDIAIASLCSLIVQPYFLTF